jgi:hypothetical protein
MIGDEADWACEHAPDATRLQVVELVEDVGAEPGLSGGALALEGERPAIQAGTLGHHLRGLEELIPVGVALVEDSRGKAVRGEDDMSVGPSHSVGEHRDVGLVRMPALDEAQLGAAGETFLEPLVVAIYREPRVVGREHDPDDGVGAATHRPIGRFRDPRAPVLHPDEHGQLEVLL